MNNITVILCTYNRCKVLAAALESLAASRVPESVHWEVLVVDNNSKDQTREVVQDFSRRYPGRFRYLFEARQGKSYALNSGIRESSGPILAFADDDATTEPDWLWNLTAALHDGESAGAGGRIVPVWPGPLPAWLSSADPHTMGPFVAFDLGPEPGPLTRPPYGANMAFRRSAFQKHGGFRADLGPRPGSEIRREDIEFAERLLTVGERLRYEPGAVVHHPVPEHRMKKSFVLTWWFWYGYSEVVESGKPSQTRWRLAGVPLYLLRRLVRWEFQWMISAVPSKRFSCRRNVSYIAGTILACYRGKGRQNTPAIAQAEIPTDDSLKVPSQVGVST
jgi:glycosyltransferase involved in cell wall biosynthesis